MPTKNTLFSEAMFSKAMVSWYDSHGRKDLPWQLDKTPYHTWLSEVMLQQTQVQTVIPYYLAFTKAFPTVKKLASAHQDQVLHLWTGLGYYSRARNLHKAAKIIVKEHKGQLPKSQEELEALPGIGRSTAGAILSLSMGKRAAILDGNVKRVLCRYHCIEAWSGSTQGQKQLWQLAEKYTPTKKVRQYNQSMMDLGATICKRGTPQCELCPLAPQCEAYITGQQKRFPIAKPKKAIPERYCHMLILESKNQALYLEQRPQTGIWGGLWSFPQFDDEQGLEDYCTLNNIKQNKAEALSPIRHTFSHFHLNIQPIYCRIGKEPAKIAQSKGLWYKDQKSQKVGLPSPVLKLINSL